LDVNEKGDRRHALEKGVEAGTLDVEVGPALMAEHVARTEPLDLPIWADIGWRVLRSILEDRLLATAGGVAFFALMAIFPALATIVSLYGLFADPHAIPERLAILAGVVPASVIGLLKLDQFARPMMRRPGGLKPHQARRQRSEELQQLVAPDRFGDHDTPQGINAVNLKDVLGQIEPNSRD
jgi:hypothetical protein